jgi:hypothetical protein
MKQTAIDILFDQIKLKADSIPTNTAENRKLKGAYVDCLTLIREAKEMEKANHEKFNKFLNDEKQLGISDLKTVERIQWYYNTYFNETFKTNKKWKRQQYNLFTT